MSGHGEKKTRKEQQLLAALLTAGSIKEAAERVGITEKTARSWMTEQFTAEYRRQQKLVLANAVAELSAASTLAVRRLRQNLEAAKASDSTRAAVAILELAMRGRELMDMGEKIAEIEERLKGLTK